MNFGLHISSLTPGRHVDSVVANDGNSSVTMPLQHPGSVGGDGGLMASVARFWQAHAP